MYSFSLFHQLIFIINKEIALIFSDVKSSRPKWPRGQNFGLGLGLGLRHLASAWPRSHCLVFAEMNPKVVTLQTLQYDLLTCIQTFCCCTCTVIIYSMLHVLPKWRY